MSLVASAKGGDFQIPDAAVYTARCYRIIDLGTQIGDYKGQQTASHKILVNWELAGTADKDGRPLMIGKKYTLSLSEKAELRKDLKAWRGREFTAQELEAFDVTKLLNAPCMMNVVHQAKDGRTYANIASIMPLPGGMVAPPLQNKTVLFSMSKYDADIFNSLSDNLKATIAKSPEYAEIVGGAAHAPPGNAQDEDIPF